MNRSKWAICATLMIAMVSQTMVAPAKAKDVDWLKVIVLNSESHWPIDGARVDTRYTMTRDYGDTFYKESDRAVTNSDGIAFVRIGQSHSTRFDSRETLEISHPEYRHVSKHFCWGDVKGTRRSSQEVAGLKIESKYNPLDWDEDWLGDPQVGDDDDMAMGIVVYMNRIAGRRNPTRNRAHTEGDGEVSATLEVYHDFESFTGRGLPCIFMKSIVDGLSEGDERKLYFKLYREGDGDDDPSSTTPLEYEPSGYYESWVRCAESLEKGGRFTGEIALCKGYGVGCTSLAREVIYVPKQR